MSNKYNYSNMNKPYIEPFIMFTSTCDKAKADLLLDYEKKTIVNFKIIQDQSYAALNKNGLINVSYTGSSQDYFKKFFNELISKKFTHILITTNDNEMQVIFSISVAGVKTNFTMKSVKYDTTNIILKQIPDNLELILIDAGINNNVTLSLLKLS